MKIEKRYGATIRIHRAQYPWCTLNSDCRKDLTLFEKLIFTIEED